MTPKWMMLHIFPLADISKREEILRSGSSRGSESKSELFTVTSPFADLPNALKENSPILTFARARAFHLFARVEFSVRKMGKSICVFHCFRFGRGRRRRRLSDAAAATARRLLSTLSHKVQKWNDANTQRTTPASNEMLTVMLVPPTSPPHARNESLRLNAFLDCSSTTHYTERRGETDGLWRLILAPGALPLTLSELGPSGYGKRTSGIGTAMITQPSLSEAEGQIKSRNKGGGGE